MGVELLKWMLGSLYYALCDAQMVFVHRATRPLNLYNA